MTKSQARSSETLPLLYKEPVVLRFEDHKRKALLPLENYRFSENVVAIPLLASEFIHAVRHYPIIFSDSENPSPLAVVGLNDGKNLFITEEGNWRAGAYVPAYLRRYPFIVTEVVDSGQQFLAIDAGSERFADIDAREDSQPLFDELGGSTELAEQAITFCQAFHVDHLRSEAFGLALKENDLLMPRQAAMQFSENDKFTMEGFSTVDAKKFQALTNPTLLQEWHANGWLNAISLHLASVQNWESLLRLKAEREQKSEQKAA
ncbi:MAG: SapC family protein [Mesorhizobium sp.]